MRERIDESTNVQTTPIRTYRKCSRPLPYCNPNCRTPRHWKFTQHHRTTRPPQGQGPTALAVVAGGGCLDIFTLLYLFSPLSPSRGWSGGAMVLGKLPVTGRPTIWIQ